LKTIKLRIFPDGRVQADVQGVKGKACTNYLGILEELLDAEVTESSYTPEYFESQSVVLEEHEQQRQDISSS
jgi:hypothetical protein